MSQVLSFIEKMTVLASGSSSGVFGGSSAATLALRRWVRTQVNGIRRQCRKGPRAMRVSMASPAAMPPPEEKDGMEAKISGKMKQVKTSEHLHAQKKGGAAARTPSMQAGGVLRP